MKQNRAGKYILLLNCILLLVTGCGGTASQTPDSIEELSSGIQTEPEDDTPNYLTLAEVKSIVIENAGLTEEQVHFVRAQLDSEGALSCYDIEFVCENATYDYTVNALNGEILAMNSSSGSYDLAAFSDTGTADDRIETAAEIPQKQNNSASVNQQSKDTSSQQQYIGTEAAKQAALDHAGLKTEEVNFVHAHLETDDGIWQYDIEFHKDTTEYDYDIDALTGEILSFDQDADYYHHAQAASAGKEQISEEKAKQLALDHAGVTEEDAQKLQIKFDYDDGRAEYEVEWHVGRTEYSCDVDAVSGAILSYDKKLD